MFSSESLEIIIVTYNRERYLKRTLDTFLAESSPVGSCQITVLDNNSSDGTAALARETATVHPNVKYRKNTYNLGISGNIFRGMEIADHDYVWIVGDDDAYDFTGWNDVAAAMESGEKVICLARYAVPDSQKNDLASQLVQITFVTGCIYSRSLFTDSAMRDAIYNTHTLFPHIVPVVHHINRGGTIFVAPKAIADNGLLLGEEKDSSYNRGVKKPSELSPRTRDTQWIVGWASICHAIHDRDLCGRTLLRGIELIHGSFDQMCRCFALWYETRDSAMLVAELYAIAPRSYKRRLRAMMVGPSRFKLLLMCLRSWVASKVFPHARDHFIELANRRFEALKIG